MPGFAPVQSGNFNTAHRNESWSSEDSISEDSISEDSMSLGSAKGCFRNDRSLSGSSAKKGAPDLEFDSNSDGFSTPSFRSLTTKKGMLSGEFYYNADNFSTFSFGNRTTGLIGDDNFSHHEWSNQGRGLKRIKVSKEYTPGSDERGSVEVINDNTQKKAPAFPLASLCKAYFTAQELWSEPTTVQELWSETTTVQLASLRKAYFTAQERRRVPTTGQCAPGQAFSGSETNNPERRNSDGLRSLPGSESVSKIDFESLKTKVLNEIRKCQSTTRSLECIRSSAIANIRNMLQDLSPSGIYEVLKKGPQHSSLSRDTYYDPLSWRVSEFYLAVVDEFIKDGKEKSRLFLERCFDKDTKTIFQDLCSSNTPTSAINFAKYVAGHNNLSYEDKRNILWLDSGLRRDIEEYDKNLHKKITEVLSGLKPPPVRAD